MSEKIKISIIGSGFVGSTTAYALMMGGLASELVIVDLNKDKAEGEAMDLSHGVSFVNPVEIKAGDYEDTANSNIVIITAGAGQKPGETRLDLIGKNYKIFSSIVPQVVKYSPNSTLLVVSNPVDVLTYITYKLSGFPKERVIGSGTVLDTSRFRYMLSQHFNIDSRNIHTYIMGEHGDSEIATWSLTNIAGMSLNEYCKTMNVECSEETQKQIRDSVKDAAYEIIQRKGATYYAVALAIKRIVEALLKDKNSILTVSSLLQGEYGLTDVCMGAPTIIGQGGIKEVLEVPLSESELKQFTDSANTLKEALQSATK